MIVYEIENREIINNNGLYQTIYETESESKYTKGLLNYKKVESKTTVNDSKGEENLSVKESIILNELEYDSYGNILLEKMEFPYNNLTQTITTSYNYEQLQNDLQKVTVTKEGISSSNVYDYNGKLVNSTDSKIKKEYKYDDYAEVLTDIEFIDVTTNNVIDKNTLISYINKGNEISNLKGLNYKFKSNYYGNINKAYKNNIRINYNMLTYSDNNYIMKEKYYNRLNNVDREIEREDIINKYDLLLETKIDNSTYATYAYDDDYSSKYGSSLQKVFTDYALYEYEFGDLYNNYIETDGDKYHTVKDALGYNEITLVEGNKHIEQTIDSTSATIDFYNEADGTFNYLSELEFYYDFDEVGRFKSKKWNIIDKEKYLEKELLYKDNSNKLDKIKYNFKLHNNKKDYSFDDTYEYDSYNNIRKIVEGKCDTTWRNEDIVNQLSNKTYTYLYDSQNRLTKEIVDNDVYDYEYDVTNGELSKVKLNNNLIKQFIYENNLLTKYVDKDNKVHFYLDKEFTEKDALIGVHPNDNTATVWLKTKDLIEIIEENGNQVNIIEI